MHFFTAYHWQKGSKTNKNQDSLALCQMVVRRKRCLMAVVCDGIGSFTDSEKASGYVTEQMVNWFFNTGPKILGRLIKRREIKNVINREIYRMRQTICTECLEQCGCTFSMLLICEHNYWIWNIGDSRIYKRHRKKITALTKDDVYNGMLTKCIGTFPGKEASCDKGRVQKGDTFLVCSDGFYRRFSDDEIKMFFYQRTSDEKQAEKLLNEASLRLRAKGENDDMSAIYICAKKAGGYLQPHTA